MTAPRAMSTRTGGATQGRDPETRGRLPYRPSLDGIRALAVLAVFAFHTGLGWMPGGFLGVSVFFTLSGYLITRLVLDEALRTRALALGAFWARRLRRLFPAALVTIGLVLILVAAGVGAGVDPLQLRGDALGALGYVANWRFLFQGNSYADLFVAPSPLLHFWSLAIEEQFYFFYPLLVAAFVVVGKPSPRATVTRLRRLLVVLLAMSVAATAIAVSIGATDFVYYSSITRAAEIVTGCLLACSFAGRTLPGASPRRWALPVGGVALAAIVVLCATTDGTEGWVTHGGLPLFSLLSVAVIAAALPLGAFATALGVLPLRALGRISYGVYLFHWPVIIWLDESAAGMSGTALVLLQAAVTLAIATISYFVVELPVRRGRFPRGNLARVMAPVAVAVMVLLTFAVPSIAVSTPRDDLAASARELDALNERSAERGVPAAGTTTVPRVAIFGDSTGLQTGLGLTDWARSTNELEVIGGDGRLGCPLAGGGTIHYGTGTVDIEEKCGTRPLAWAGLLASLRPDVVVMQFGPFDVADRNLDGVWQWVGQPGYDAHLEAQMREAAQILQSTGATVVWLTSPHIESGRDRVPPQVFPEDDPARMDRFNQLLRQVARESGIEIVDLAGWLRRQPGGELDPALRPDGVHFTRETARLVSEEWLGEAIGDAIRRHEARRP